MELSVVIPAYNEAERISETLSHTISWLQQKGIKYEIIVVDDGSEDSTRGVVKKYAAVKLTNPRENRGKGFSVRQGMLLADKKYVLFMDADNSTKIDELEKFLPLMKEADIIIGSRNIAGSILVQKQPWVRSMLGKMFPLFVRILCVRGIKDTQCGFKLFTRDAAQKLCRLQTLERFAFDVELLYLAQKFKYRIKELPITWTNDEKSTVRLLTPVRMLVSLFKIRLGDLRGKYHEEKLS